MWARCTGFRQPSGRSVAIAEKDPEPLMFALFAGLNAYQAVVLLVPYRRLQPWAWWLTWVFRSDRT